MQRFRDKEKCEVFIIKILYYRVSGDNLLLSSFLLSTAIKFIYDDIDIISLTRDYWCCIFVS